MFKVQSNNSKLKVKWSSFRAKPRNLIPLIYKPNSGGVRSLHFGRDDEKVISVDLLINLCDSLKSKRLSLFVVRVLAVAHFFYVGDAYC